MLSLLLISPALAYKVPVFRVGDEQFVLLEDMALFYGLSTAPENGRSIALENPWSSLEFEFGSRRAWINGIHVWLHAPLQKIDHRWAITQTDMSTFVDPVLRTYAHLAAHDDRVVLLDPGHGGHDPGAVGRSGLQEKDVALAIARRVRANLAQQGLRVYMTRDSDRFVELSERCQVADRRRADIFVSIHLNSAHNGDAHGLESYVLTAPGYASAQAAPEARVRQVHYTGNGHDGANTSLAFAIQKSLVQQTGATDRGLRHARFLVLKHAPCPAALVECGFLSNSRDESLLRNHAYVEEIGQGIAQGILAYFDAVRRAKVVAQSSPLRPGTQNVFSRSPGPSMRVSPFPDTSRVR